MRRPATQTVDVSETLLRVLLGVRGDESLSATALAILVYLGQQPGYRASLAEIQLRIGLPQQGTSYHCGLLVRKGFVRRTAATKDRRTAGIELATRGLRRIDKK